MINSHAITGWIVVLILCLGHAMHARAQSGEGPISLFGYYQNSYQYTTHDTQQDRSTFLLQQLNLIAQKDLAPKLRSFVSFEFLNTFESNLEWGSASLKEAWVRYDMSPRLKFKFGLQIPFFNHLNEVKTRTPLLPYIIRPIVYETSLSEIISVEDFVPERAFVQAYGSTAGSENLSFDYAAFIGNSPNINDNPAFDQTGVDTTNAMLVGARVGLRWDNLDSDWYELRAGLSATHDRVNNFVGAASLLSDDPDEVAAFEKLFEKISRWRIGADLGIYWREMYLHAEFISVFHGEGTPALDVDKFFWYGTLGYNASERFEPYLSFWRTKEFGLLRDSPQVTFYLLDQLITLNVYTAGAKYNITPRLVLKAQYALVDLDNREMVRSVAGGGPTTTQVELGNLFSVYSVALSVFF